MNLDQVMSELAAKGSEATKKIFVKHGAKEPFFGVKVADLKVIHKRIKGDQALALQLYETAGWGMISGTIVPWVASEHPEGFALASKWIDSPKVHVAVAGWRTLGAIAAVVADDQLPIKPLAALLDRIAKEIAGAPDDVKLAMNHFIIACGTYVAPLATKAVATARKVGKVEADMGDTACQIPDAESYILKSRRGAPIAPKRKTVRC